MFGFDAASAFASDELRSVGAPCVGYGLGASARLVLSLMVRLGNINQQGAGLFGFEVGVGFGIGPGLMRKSHF